jgi:hypothetical protein
MNTKNINNILHRSSRRINWTASPVVSERAGLEKSATFIPTFSSYQRSYKPKETPHDHKYTENSSNIPFVNTKQAFNLAAYNVRSLKQEGNLELLSETLGSMDIDICCFSETRISELHPLSLKDSKGKVFKYTFSHDTSSNTGQAGVDILLKVLS